jgi:DNA-binding response OmpR family regulator
MAAKIILAEDERVFRHAISNMLSVAGYEVREAKNGAEAIALFKEGEADLMLLDVMMPIKNGYEVSREIRALGSDVPIIFLTALDKEGDELSGFGAGADDYVSKTSSDEILLARISAALRRSSGIEKENIDFKIGEWMVEPMKGRMTHGNEKPVGLTLREIEMLRFFLSNEGEIFSRDFLMTKFWGLDYSGSESAVTQAISRLREKLGKGKGCMIESVYGQGFRLMVSIGK